MSTSLFYPRHFVQDRDEPNRCTRSMLLDCDADEKQRPVMQIINDEGCGDQFDVRKTSRSEPCDAVIVRYIQDSRYL